MLGGLTGVSYSAYREEMQPRETGMSKNNVLRFWVLIFIVFISTKPDNSSPYQRYEWKEKTAPFFVNTVLSLFHIPSTGSIDRSNFALARQTPQKLKQIFKQVYKIYFVLYGSFFPRIWCFEKYFLWDWKICTIVKKASVSTAPWSAAAHKLSWTMFFNMPLHYIS